MIVTVSAIRVEWSTEHPWQVRLVDVGSGRDYRPECLEMDFHLGAKGDMYADLLLITDADGHIQSPGGPAVLSPSGVGYCKGVFRFAVSEMTVA